MNRKLFAILICLFSLFSLVCTKAADGGEIKYATFPVKMLPKVSQRDYAVYLPESYDKDSDRLYPVLYLLHGGFGSYKDWPTLGSLKETADRLMSDGTVAEMIIICPDGRCRDNTMWLDMEGWYGQQHFFDELIPYMEGKYRIKGGKSGRAIAGLSLGGGAALTFALARPEMFAASAGLSAYLRSVPEVSGPRMEWIQSVVDANSPVDRIESASAADLSRWKDVAWLIDCGNKDFTLKSNVELDEAMNRQDIPHEFLMRKGTHSWKYWSESLPIVLKFIDSVLCGSSF